MVGLQPTAWPSGPGVIKEQEPAVGLEPTSSALRGRCPARRASPAFGAARAGVEQARPRFKAPIPSRGPGRQQVVQESNLPTRVRRPSARSRETTRSTPCQSRTGQPAFGGPVPEAARQGSVDCQSVRGELNPPPRPSQGRMLVCYTTNTIVPKPATQ